MSTSPAISPAHQRLASARANLGPVPFAKTVSTRRTAGFSQADTRHPLITTDQHGRQWSCQVENRSGMPTGLIANDFSAPWLPDQSYIIVNPNNPGECWIDYRHMYLDRRKEMGLYHQLAVQLASDKSWPLPERGNYSREFRRLLGNPPQPLEPVKAAAQGNPWILGFTDVPDPRLVEFVQQADEIDLDMDEGDDFGEEAYRDALDGSYGAGNVRERGTSAPVVDRFAEMKEALAVDEFPDEDGDEDDEEGAAELADARADLEESLGARTVADAGGDAEELLDAIDTAADPAQLGGRTVGTTPRAAERAQRQAPRRPAQSKPTSKRGASRGSTMRSLRREHGDKAGLRKGRSLADGARPRVSSEVNTNERLIEQPAKKE